MTRPKGPAPDEVGGAAEQPPTEPVVFLVRTERNGTEFYEVRDEEGTLGATIDPKDGSAAGVTERATEVVGQLRTQFFTPADATAPTRRGWLPTRRARTRPLVVCLTGPAALASRCYVSRLDDRGGRDDLGWIDRSDGRVVEVVDGSSATLRFCAAQLARLGYPR